MVAKLVIKGLHKSPHSHQDTQFPSPTSPIQAQPQRNEGDQQGDLSVL